MEDPCIRFKEMRKRLSITQEELGNILSLTGAAISDIERGKVNPSIKSISDLEYELHVNSRWLLTGNGEMFLEPLSEIMVIIEGFRKNARGEADLTQDEISSIYTKYEKTDAVAQQAVQVSNGKNAQKSAATSYIELLSAKACAGSGIENYDISVIDMIPVPSSVIRPYPDNKVKAMLIEGDSMTPTIFNGDYVFYAPGITAGNGIYVIDVFGELRCKRIEFKLNGDISVISDNERYEKEYFSRGDETLRICGKVLGWTHKHNY